MKYFNYLFLCLFGALPLLASAHVKWFVDTQDVTSEFHNQTVFYSWGSKEVLVWSLIVFIVVLAFGFVDKKLKAPKSLVSFGLKNEKTINRVSQAVLGVFLISVSFLWKIIIIPDFEVASNASKILLVLQILIGLAYLVNWKPKYASVLLFVLTLSTCLYSGLDTLLENIILISLSIYFYIVNSKETSFVYKKFHNHAVEIVRLGTGISLIVLAFTEKLLYPELSLAFLDIHHWNFMQAIFPWFTNNLFVLSTGFAEMIFGILFIMGYITRITTILIAIFFAFSVTTMLIQFGAWEVEDLVVYSAAILFIFFGHGLTKFFYFSFGK